MAKLYELSEAYNQIYDQVLDQDADIQLIEESLNAVEGLIEDKAENIAKLIHTINADVEAIKSEEQRLSNRRKSLENKAESLKTYLGNQMISIGKEKFKTTLFSFNIQANPPSIKIENEFNFRMICNKKYLVPQEPAIDKKLLLADLKNGQAIEGVTLFQGKSLRIR